MAILRLFILAAILLINGVTVNNLAFADEIGDLKKQVQELREDYEAKIERLQSQFDALSKDQEEKVSQIQKKMEDRLITTEYVGRYEGPFGKGGLLIKNPSGFGNVSLGGYGDIEFESFENANSTFDQARFVLNVGAQPHERVLFYSEFELEHGGTNYPGGDGEAKIEQAWMNYAVNDWLSLKGGIFLVPFGKFNLLHDSDIQELTDRPLFARRLIPSTWTDAGFGFLGEIPVGEKFNWKIFPDFYLNYESYVGNGLDEDISDRGLRDARGSASNDLNNNKDFVTRLGFGLNRNLEIGLSTYYGKFGRSGNSTRNGKDGILGIGSDIDFKRGPFEIAGDFAYFDFEEGALVDHDNSNTTAAVSAPKYMRGFYVEPRYHFWPKFLSDTFLGRGFKDPKLTLVGRYDWVDIGDDGDAGTGANRERRYTMGMNYRPIPSWVFKLEYQW
ncbi:MAG: porin, partial [Candidatus Omnitrophota bacterium]